MDKMEWSKWTRLGWQEEHVPYCNTMNEPWLTPADNPIANRLIEQCIVMVQQYQNLTNINNLLDHKHHSMYFADPFF